MADASDQTDARYLRYVLEQTGDAPGALAKKAGVAASTLTRRLNSPDHKFVLSTTTLRKIEAASGISYAAFASGKLGSIVDPRYVPLDDEGREIVSDQPVTGEGYNRESWRPKIPGALPELDVRAGAGEGMVGEIVALPMGGGVISAHKVIEEWPIPMSYLREAVRDPRQAIVMAIDGDSMLPNYAPGDRVVIDLSQDRFEADGVYLISYDLRHPQVKRLQAVPLTVPPKVTIISDNPSYKNFDAELDLLRIHGRVCAYVGRR